MTIVSTLEWIESTDLSTAIREGALPYPIIGGVHLLAIALFGGMLVARICACSAGRCSGAPVSDIVRAVPVVEARGLRGGGGQRFAAGLGRAAEALPQPVFLGQDGAAARWWACTRWSFARASTGTRPGWTTA